MKQCFGVGLRLLFTDTDSLCMEIKHNNPMLWLSIGDVLNEWFDMDEYPVDDSYYGLCFQSSKNKKVIGKFKDEMVKDGKGVYITEVVALRSKMYSCLQSDGINKKTAKGVSTAAKRKLIHEKYVKCVKQDPDFQIENDNMTSIRSTNNELFLTQCNKVTLSPCDSKLYLTSPTTTLPYGHYSIPHNT